MFRSRFALLPGLLFPGNCAVILLENKTENIKGKESFSRKG
jgi:hypothetical protein